MRELRIVTERLLEMRRPDGTLPLGTPANRAATLRLVPYFANLGAYGLAVVSRVDLSDPARRRRCREAVREWALWYDAHRNPDGTVYDFEGRVGAWRSTGKYDSTDSYASTYLEMLSALHRSEPDTKWLKSRYPFVRRSLDAIRLTLQKNGLTTATPTWPVMYTMDNVEVLRGLRAAVILAQAMGEAGDAAAWTTMANTAEASIARDLWDSSTGCYRVGLQTDGGVMAGGTSKWYPDVMANLMAIGWLPSSARNRTLYQRLITETAGSPDAGIPTEVRAEGDLERLGWWGFAARGAGDSARLAQIRVTLLRGITASLPLTNPAPLGHACRLLSKTEE